MSTTERLKRAKALRDQGMTYRAIGDEMGVSPSRARQIVKEAEREKEREEKEKADPSLIPWDRGLRRSVADTLRLAGVKSREDYMLLAADLPIHRRCWVQLDELPIKSIWPMHGRKVMHISEVNEVREWLGVPKLVVPPRKATEAELKRARNLLEQHGWTVIPPDDAD